MKNPKTKLSEVAQILGYSEMSSFRRAFKLWTKSTPKAFSTG
ncbi:helix-turn-helix domain-containing protein [Christiangramia antarctica]|uniref:Helix-turn-helix domain-containing protein n=1 Tax=Christiangramia antarctica TaxID=2058158 RepID=A0ABW5X483_9FLAO